MLILSPPVGYWSLVSAYRYCLMPHLLASKWLRTKVSVGMALRAQRGMRKSR